MALHFRVAKLAFRLSLELGLEDFDADHRGQAFAHVLS